MTKATTTEHTPTPYTPTPYKGPCEPNSNFERRVTVKSMDGETVAIMVGKDAKARKNAAFIVRAHDELVAALREAQAALNGAPNTVGLHNQIEAALAKAQEGV